MDKYVFQFTKNCYLAKYDTITPISNKNLAPTPIKPMEFTHLDIFEIDNIKCN